MQFGDLLDLKTGPEAIVRLALYPLLIVVIGSLAATIVSQLNGLGLLLATLFLVLVSPAAYALRERRQGQGQRPGIRRGAERTPLVPPIEEEE